MANSSVFSLLGLILLWVVISLSRKAKTVKKSRNAGNGVSKTVYSSPRQVLSGKVHDAGHTHDRLDYDCAIPNESRVQHYRKQLDSFMKAGLIEKDEYNKLLLRYMTEFK